MIRIFEASRTILGVDLSVRLVRFVSQSHRVILSALLLIVAVAICLSAGSAQAVPINYGDFMGNTVTYLMVREDSNSSDDTPPLFGAPSVSGDSLDFDPVGFGASADGAGGIDRTDGNLAFMVKAKPGNAILNLLISEFGDVSLGGFGSDTTYASVKMQGILNISEVDFVGLNVISIPFSITNFGPSGGTYGLGTDGGGGPEYDDGWSGSVLLDLTTGNPVVAAALAAQGVVPVLGVTKISVNFDNKLLAISQAGTTSLIAKKDTNGIIVTTNIPEPTSCLLAMFGLVVGGLAARRSR